MERDAKVFRGIVALSAISYVIAALFPYLPVALYTEQQLKLLSFSGEGAVIPNTWEYWAVLSLIQLALSVGVYLWNSRCRDLLAVLVAYQLISYPLQGVSVGLPYENYFYSMSWLLTGAALGLAYFSELRMKFK